MNLRERLRLLSTGSVEPSLPEETPEDLQEINAALDEHLGGHLVETPAGETYCVERTYPLSYRRGSVSIGDAREVPGEAWQLLVGERPSCGLSLRDAVFIDTETTGLERGAGTYAFLVGVGRFVGDTYRVRQLFMRDYDEEEALLHALLTELEEASCLVTFNGRTFDWPLLQTRATLNRLRLPELPHIDLLHPSRRLWRPVTENCRLVQLEAEILGLERYDDVPGFLIPQLYFEFLETRDPVRMGGVIDHNRFDILSTAALAAYLGQAAAQPLAAAPTGAPLPGSDLFALGRILLERNELTDAIGVLEEAIRRGLPGALLPKCQQALATAYRRADRHDEAARVWHTMASEAGTSTLPYIELAKYYEHRVKDLAEARRWTLRAIESVQGRRLLRGVGPRAVGGAHPADIEMEELLHRLQRLDAKLSRSWGRRKAR